MSATETKVIKRKKLSIKKILILLLVVYLFGCFINYLLKLPIKNISITGTSFLKDHEIIEQAGIKDYPSIFRTSTNELTKLIEEIPLVNTVKIKKNILGKITIVIEENKVLFYNRNSKTLILSDKSEIDFTNEYLGIPVLNNSVKDNIYEIFIEQFQKIDISNIGLISEIQYDPLKSNNTIIDETRFLFRMNDGNTVYISTNDFTPFNSYIEMSSTFKEEKGTLNLDSITGKYLFTPYKDEVGEENTSDEL